MGSLALVVSLWTMVGFVLSGMGVGGAMACCLVAMAAHIVEVVGGLWRICKGVLHYAS